MQNQQKNSKQNKRNIIIITIILLLLLLMSCSAKFIFNKDSQTSETSSRKESLIQTSYLNKNDSEPKNNKEYTEIIGFDIKEVNKDDPYINLINSINNDVYLSFDVYLENNLIYESGLISPGNQEQLNVYDLLDAGNHILTYNICSYTLDNKITLWKGINQIQEILIIK